MDLPNLRDDENWLGFVVGGWMVGFVVGDFWVKLSYGNFECRREAFGQPRHSLWAL